MKNRLKKFWNEHPQEIQTVAYFGTLASLTAYSVYKVVTGKDVVSANYWSDKESNYSEVIVKLKNGYSVVLPFNGTMNKNPGS